jgi:hypothetical protein
VNVKCDTNKEGYEPVVFNELILQTSFSDLLVLSVIHVVHLEKIHSVKLRLYIELGGVGEANTSYM